MINAIIVEDEEKSRNALKKLLSTFCPDINVKAEADSVDDALQIINNNAIDLIFLDIEMPEKNGFELIKSLDKGTYEVIFITAFNNYALDAIKISAIDYLLKPIDIEELIEAVNKAQKQIGIKNSNDRLTHLVDNLNDKKNQKIGIPTMQGFSFINIEEIIRCEADQRYTQIHTKDGKKCMSTRNLKEFEHLLEQHPFFRVHHSHLINLNFIDKYVKGEGSYVIMIDGANVAVSRRRKDKFLEQLNTL